MKRKDEGTETKGNEGKRGTGCSLPRPCRVSGVSGTATQFGVEVFTQNQRGEDCQRPGTARASRPPSLSTSLNLLEGGSACDVMKTQLGIRDECVDRYGDIRELPALRRYWPGQARRWFDAFDAKWRKECKIPV